jgi:hypothetical protein
LVLVSDPVSPSTNLMEKAQYFYATFPEYHSTSMSVAKPRQIEALACALYCTLNSTSTACRSLGASIAPLFLAAQSSKGKEETDIARDWLEQGLRDMPDHQPSSFSYSHSFNLVQVLWVLYRADYFFTGEDHMTCFAVRTNKSGSRWAIISVPKALASKTSSNDVSLAVPAANNTPDAHYLRRVWIIDKKDSSLLGRGYLLGIDALDMEIDDLVSYRQNVKITGGQREKRQEVELDMEDDHSVSETNLGDTQEVDEDMEDNYRPKQMWMTLKLELKKWTSMALKKTPGPQRSAGDWQTFFR